MAGKAGSRNPNSERLDQVEKALREDQEREAAARRSPNDLGTSVAGIRKEREKLEKRRAKQANESGRRTKVIKERTDKSGNENRDPDKGR